MLKARGPGNEKGSIKTNDKDVSKKLNQQNKLKFQEIKSKK